MVLWFLEKYFAEQVLNLNETFEAEVAYTDAEFVIFATSANYDTQKNFFAVEVSIDLVLKNNPDAVMVIKSCIPLGSCHSLYVKCVKFFATDPTQYGKEFNLLFSPEFLWGKRGY